MAPNSTRQNVAACFFNTTGPVAPRSLIDEDDLAV